MAIHAREQEVLARANRHYSRAGRRLVGTCQELGDSAVYLHSVLKDFSGGQHTWHIGVLS